MQKHVNHVDLVKTFPTHILLQNLASIQKRTSPVKFAHLAEKSGKGSISNLSTKVEPTDLPDDLDLRDAIFVRDGLGVPVVHEAAVADLADLEDELLRVGTHFVRQYESAAAPGAPRADRTRTLLDLYEAEELYMGARRDLLRTYVPGVKDSV